MRTFNDCAACGGSGDTLTLGASFNQWPEAALLLGRVARDLAPNAGVCLCCGGTGLDVPLLELLDALHALGSDSASPAFLWIRQSNVSVVGRDPAAVREDVLWLMDYAEEHGALPIALRDSDVRTILYTFHSLRDLAMRELRRDADVGI